MSRESGKLGLHFSEKGAILIIDSCGIGISVLCGLPKAKRRVRLPYPAPEKKQPLSTKTKVVSFQRNPPCRVGEIIFDDEIPFGDEIRLDGGWVDFISSAKQISLKSERIRGIISETNLKLTR